MAPEQTVGDRSLDARADIYALGAVMYHALTGQPPFVGENAFAIMMAHSRDPVVPPSQLNPSVPADLEQVVLRCLAKKPEDRFPSAKALGQALAACAAASEWGANRAEAWWAAEGMFVQPEENASSRPRPRIRLNLIGFDCDRPHSSGETSMPTRPASRVGASLTLLIARGLDCRLDRLVGAPAGPIRVERRTWRVAARAAAAAAPAEPAAAAAPAPVAPSPRQRKRSGRLMIST